WRTAVAIQPRLLSPLLGELFASGARPEELASVASAEPSRMLDVVDFLRDRRRLPDAFVVLDQADALGAPRGQTLLARGRLELDAGDLPKASDAARAAATAGVQD